MEKTELFSIAAIFILSFAIRSAIAYSVGPFMMDEPNYAQTLDELVSKPELIPRYLGEPVAWKPPFFFYAYRALGIFKLPGAPLEFSYRLPTVLISSLSAVLLYLLLKRFMARGEALMAAVLYAASGLPVVMGSLLMVDSLFMFLFLLGFLLYIKGLTQEHYFLLAGLCVFLAFLTKYNVALIIPLLGAFYCIRKRRGIAKNRNFLASLLGIPLALLFLLTVFSLGNSLGALFFNLSFEMFHRAAPSANLAARAVSNAFVMFSLIAPLIVLAVIGVARINWKSPEGQTILLWASLSFVVLLNVDPSVFWYSLPVIPAFAALASRGLGEGKVQWAVLLAVIPVSLILLLPSLIVFQSSDARDAGTYLSGKGDVELIVPAIHYLSWPDYYSFYRNSTVSSVSTMSGVIYYKLHWEEEHGRMLASFYPPIETGEEDFALPEAARAEEAKKAVEEHIRESSSQTILVYETYRCKKGPSYSTCRLNITIPDGFSVGFREGKFLILERNG